MYLSNTLLLWAYSNEDQGLIGWPWLKSKRDAMPKPHCGDCCASKRKVALRVKPRAQQPGNAWYWSGRHAVPNGGQVGGGEGAARLLNQSLGVLADNSKAK